MVVQLCVQLVLTQPHPVNCQEEEEEEEDEEEEGIIIFYMSLVF